MNRKRKRIRIRVKGGWAVATAHETSHPNLFVTAYRMVYGKQGRKFLVAESDHLFVVTHKPTGRRMSDALTLKEAKILAERYAASGIPFEKIRTRRSAAQYRDVADEIWNSFNQWRTA